MRSEPVVTTFDYAVLDPKVAAEARQIADHLRDRIRTFTYETGRDLLGIKEKMPHGTFGLWIDAEFQMSERTAQNYMNAARLVEGKSANISLLPPSALYALGAPSAPPEVVEEVLAEIERGAVPKVADIRERIAGVTKAMQAAKNAKTAEQIKKEKENEKRNRAAQAAREQKRKAEHEEYEAKRNDTAREVAALLINKMGAAGVVDVLAALSATDWHRVERFFIRSFYPRVGLTVAEIEAAFPGAAS